MRSALISAVMLLQVSGAAVALDDQSVCRSITQKGSGLFLAYPVGASALQRLGPQATCAESGGFCFVKVSSNNVFDDLGRFYFVPAPIPRAEEGVWHIRTQTQAVNLNGADLAYLSRPTTSTRCSPNQSLPGFPSSLFPNGPYAELNDYIDHHNGRPVGILTRYFHFNIQETPGSSYCISTDDRAAFGNLNSIYGFENVTRGPKLVARYGGMGTALAGTNAYAGLSSEFAYQDNDDPACFGFAMPRPTRTEYLNQGIDWRPYLTKIWIKRIRGRQVLNESGATGRLVTWSR